MPLTYAYPDQYLASSVTEDRETRAMADVDAVATFAASWRERLVILRSYIITCLECQAQPDDLFAAKLKQYRQEYDTQMTQAKANTLDTNNNPLPGISVPLERG